jgi:hypothetical protein
LRRGDIEIDGARQPDRLVEPRLLRPYGSGLAIAFRRRVLQRWVDDEGARRRRGRDV